MARGGTGTKGVPRDVREGQIVEVAAAHFDRDGYAHVSMNAIAAAAGISKPLIYEYFGSKDELYAACVRAAGERLVTAVSGAAEASVATDATTTRALTTLRAIFDSLEEHRHDWGLIYDASVPASTSAHALVARYRRRLNEYGFAGTAESTAGRRDPLDQSLMTHLWFGILAVAMRWWHDHPDETAATMTARCQRILQSLSEEGSRE
ncbi:TetR/AcrR family transcriptional regulator [Luteipulveratus mongoliensis]|uniref:HTH tetR-type domain-containing protein n=1 Tax=Luteipulveratus mongoliensis TaxID=571913 RepID=A0A0K1JFP6_9MICO|nr:TetR/AcrR family transcriptional regulator [Luteipulveratus mongoliensis]AKU15415.1 hypothetical protein VV02_05275 [Luteipulveratus mongoliensis]